MIISKSRDAKKVHEGWCPYAKRISSKYRKFITKDDALKHGYEECSYCGGTHGVFLNIQRDPDLYGKQGRKKLSFSYDRKEHALGIRSDIGFWKVLVNGFSGKYALYHLNKSNFSPIIPDKYLMRRFFHRQSDFKETNNMSRIIEYVFKHDKAKQLMWDGDYRKLPRTTKKQKKYYKQAKKKQIRKEINRVNDIFAKLEREEQLKHG